MIWKKSKKQSDKKSNTSDQIQYIIDEPFVLKHVVLTKKRELRRFALFQGESLLGTRDFYYAWRTLGNGEYLVYLQKSHTYIEGRYPLLLNLNYSRIFKEIGQFCFKVGTNFYHISEKYEVIVAPFQVDGFTLINLYDYTLFNKETYLYWSLAKRDFTVLLYGLLLFILINVGIIAFLYYDVHRRAESYRLQTIKTDALIRRITEKTNKQTSIDIKKLAKIIMDRSSHLPDDILIDSIRVFSSNGKRKMRVIYKCANGKYCLFNKGKYVPKIKGYIDEIPF